jgi:hypothetical protein
MKRDTRTQVIQLLESYNTRERQIAVLQYALEHPTGIREDQMIETMNFAHGDGGGRAEGHISNKTMYIALNYGEQAEHLNRKERDEVARRLIELEREQNRLKYYISLLDERQAWVIQLSYIKKIPQDQAAAELQVSIRTVQSLKGRAIAALTEMYQIAEKFH